MALSKDELIRTIELAIGTLDEVYRNPADESDLYEASLLAIAAEAAGAAGASCLITNDGVTVAPPLKFRRQPGNLNSGDFSYILATFQGGKAVEIHLGVYVAGKSGVLHECDVAVLAQEEAERSRTGAVHPRSRGLVAAIEAKHYAGPPRLRVGREFLGLASEMGAAKCALAFPAPGTTSITPLLAKHPSELYDELIPGTPPADRLCAHLTQKIKNWVAAR
ncbi:hypothetical protein [Micromonospora thermarum]|uniref:Uncharacterized protein n=1 Tax=Micromonospora thermarum TaxID=2720024 RepID=A0ABX0ZG95_9ACTN|nr:hypothetical protein [Micromonospora thermarum]NJP34835.1 hypothetical protein [Micromonospora thermarum]